MAAILGFIVLPLGRKKAIYITSQFWSTLILLSIGVRLRVSGVEHVPLKRPVIFVSNHTSNIDTPVLFKVLPVPLFFIAKKELRKVPFLGWIMAAFGMIFIERGNKEKSINSLKKAAKQIRNGKSVMTFPEGTRTNDGSVKRFKKGAFALAIDSGVDVVPIAIKGAFKLNPPGSYTLHSGLVRVVIGEPVRIADYMSNGPGLLSDMVRKKVIELHKQ